MIEFQKVDKYYANKRVIEQLDFTIQENMITVIIGASGSGKSTTLRMVNRLEPHDAGKILFQGEEIASFKPEDLRRRMGYAIQSNGLFPHWTVAENIATVPRLLKWSADKIAARVDELLEMLSLNPVDYRNRMPHQLSGGQQQRVGIARAMAANPEILLMDEPFGALDPITRATIQHELKQIQARYKKTILVITHDIKEALYLADHLVLMDAGKIVQQGSPMAILHKPANDYVRGFVGGGDAGLKMLSAAQVRDYVRSGEPSQTDVTISANETMEAALSLFVSANTQSIRVLDDQTNTQGHLLFEDILKVTAPSAATN